MVYRFILISDEVDDFMREIMIDSEASFFDFHEAILNSVNYTKDLMTSFFLCNDHWEKEQEITLVEMNTGSEYDNYIMEDISLDEFISEEKQKLLYVFDYVSDRVFFIELKEIIPGKNMNAPVCSNKKGTPPEQFQIESFDVEKPVAANAPIIDENFYGDEDFDIEELDEESFSDMDFSEDFENLK